MKLTERLNIEHGVFLRQLQHLQELVRRGEPRPILEAAARTIAVALAAHDAMEDRLLYPLLARTFGPEYPPLAAARAEHARIDMALGEIVTGHFDNTGLQAFIELLSAHIETEIHLVFPLAEAWIPSEELCSLGNWNVEHIVEGPRPAAGWNLVG